jgi:hypothetical protein
VDSFDRRMLAVFAISMIGYVFMTWYSFMYW